MRCCNAVASNEKTNLLLCSHLFDFSDLIASDSTNNKQNHCVIVCRSRLRLKSKSYSKDEIVRTVFLQRMNLNRFPSEPPETFSKSRISGFFSSNNCPQSCWTREA